MILGVRDAQSQKDSLNPPRDMVISPGAQLIYMAARNVLAPVQ